MAANAGATAANVAPGVIPPAPPAPALMPAPAPMVSFRSHVFDNPNKDPKLGQYANLLNPFLLVVDNPTNNIQPTALHAQIAAKGASLDPLALDV